MRRLEILAYDGQGAWAGPTPPGEIYPGLDRIATDHLAGIRRGYPRIRRRVSGHNPDSLLSENGFDVARALIGSESTVVTALRAEPDLLPVPPYQSLLVLGHDDICAVADDVPRLPEHCSPTRLEALDGRMAQLVREEGAYLDSLDILRTRANPAGGAGRHRVSPPAGPRRRSPPRAPTAKRPSRPSRPRVSSRNRSGSR